MAEAIVVVTVLAVFLVLLMAVIALIKPFQIGAIGIFSTRKAALITIPSTLVIGLLITIGAALVGSKALESDRKPTAPSKSKADSGVVPWPSSGYVETCGLSCGEGPKRIAIAPLDISGVNVNATVTLTNDYVTAPEMTEAMGKAIAQTAQQLQDGNVKVTPDTQWVQFQIVSVAEHGAERHDLANIRVPLAAVLSAKGETDQTIYLDMADSFELGTDGLADGKSERYYCESYRKESPHFCGLVDAELARD